MKKTILTLLILIATVSLNAAQYRNALEEPPTSDSPVGVYLQFQKAAAKEDLEAMRSLSTGHVSSMLEHEKAVKNYMTRAKDIDWSKPIMWAHKIDGDIAKIGIKYKQITNGKTFNVMSYSKKVDGMWKFSGTD